MYSKILLKVKRKSDQGVTNETTRKTVEENGSGPMSRDANSVQQQKFGSDPNLDNLSTLAKPPTKDFSKTFYNTTLKL